MFQFLQGISGLNIIAVFIAVILVMCISFSMHEFAHAFTAVKFGDITPKMLGRYTLNPLKHIDPIGFICLFIFGFGWAKPVIINPNNFKSYKKGMFWTSISGVLTNILMAFISSLLWVVCIKYFNTGNFASVLLNTFFAASTLFNVNLFVFNLIPLYPLDGFNVILALSKNSSKWIKFNTQYGQYLLIVVVLLLSVPLAYLNTFIIDGFLSLWGLFI